MSDPRLYQSDTYVLLEPGKPEQFCSAADLLEKLTAILAQQPDHLPVDIIRQPTLAAQATYVLESYCDLTLEPGRTIQWYAVRLEKPSFQSAPDL